MGGEMYVDYKAKAEHDLAKKKSAKKRQNQGSSFLEKMMAKSGENAQKKYWEVREERRRKMRKQLAYAYAQRAIWKRVLDMEQSQAMHGNEMISRRENQFPVQSEYVNTELNQAYGMYEKYAMVSVVARKMSS